MTDLANQIVALKEELQVQKDHSKWFPLKRWEEVWNENSLLALYPIWIDSTDNSITRTLVKVYGMTPNGFVGCCQRLGVLVQVKPKDFDKVFFAMLHHPPALHTVV